MKHLALCCFLSLGCGAMLAQQPLPATKATVTKTSRHDVSGKLRSTAAAPNLMIIEEDEEETGDINRLQPGSTKVGKDVPFSTKAVNTEVEQVHFGTGAGLEMITSFDGLGEGFTGPQGTATLRNPSDNSLAVGRDHVVQIVNSRMAIFSKQGKVLYGPAETRNVFRGFGGPCEKMNNGDAVVRYDQLADRWLIVMPTFRKALLRNEDTLGAKPLPFVQPGNAEPLFIPAAKSDTQTVFSRQPRQPDQGSYCMCYAVSTSPDPFGSYYRYEFKRDLFPDYPRPAVWPDGYYTSTSTGDNVIERHAYVVDRTRMLKGEAATEQSFIIKDVNFLVNADLDGKQLPPAGAPNIMLATGGAQLNKITNDDGIYVWKYHVDWKDPSKTKLEGPEKLTVSPYEYLGGGQLTKAVPQPGTEQRLDAQGDKLMARVVYRRLGKQQSIVAVHSVNTAAGGGVRWYEFRLDKKQNTTLYQQGTYAPGGNFRWLASPAMDGDGNIGIGYSFGGEKSFVGQRFAGRLAGDTLGRLTLTEAILAEGEAAQTSTLRWEDYTQTAVDPTDDKTIWYVGDYFKKGGKNYSTKIGAFRLGSRIKKKPLIN